VPAGGGFGDMLTKRPQPITPESDGGEQ